MATQSQAIVVKPDENVKIIHAELARPAIAEQVTKALSNLTRYVTPEKLIRVAMTAIRGDEKLAMSTPVSIIGSVIQLAQVALVPDGFLGQAYLVPYFNKHIKRYEASPLIGYRGYGELAVRSGKATSVDGHVVYAGDVFDFEQGSNPFIKHKPCIDPKKRGDMLGAYAIVFMKEGPHRFEFMAMDEIMKVRDASQGADSNYSPWKTWFAEMARKSPMRRLAKWVPLSPEFQMAAGIDEAAELGTARTVVDNATGQVFFVQKGDTTESVIERPTRASEVKQGVAQAAVVEQTAGEAKAETSSGASTAKSQPGSVSPACFCNCCKSGTCTCPTVDEFNRCGCGPCKLNVAAPVIGEESKTRTEGTEQSQPTGTELFPQAGQRPKPEGPFISDKQRAKLIIASKAVGWSVTKDSKDDPLHKFLLDRYGVISLTEVPSAVFEEILKAVGNSGDVKMNLK